MTLINLNFIQFYQPLVKADLTNKRLSITSIDNVFVICEEGHTSTISRFNDEWNESLNDYDLIEVLNSTDSGDKEKYESFPSFKELVLDIKRAQESQQSNLRLDEDKSANVDSSSSVYSRSDDSTSKQGERHYPLWWNSANHRPFRPH